MPLSGIEKILNKTPLEGGLFSQATIKEVRQAVSSILDVIRDGLYHLKNRAKMIGPGFESALWVVIGYFEILEVQPQLQRYELFRLLQIIFNIPKGIYQTTKSGTC